MPSRKKTSARKTGRKKTPARKRSVKNRTTKKKSAARAKPARKKTATKGKKKASRVKKKARVARKTTSAAKKKKKKAPTRKKTAARKGRRKTTSRKGRAKTTARRKTTRRSKVTTMTGPVSGIDPYIARRGESYMNDKQHQHFLNILHTWKQQLMQEVDRTVHHMKDEAANFPDPNDRATQESEFSLELRTRDRERKLIKKIDEALVTVDSGEYGFCESCGVEIGVRRLEARPTATLCIDCKTLDEIRERQQRT